MLLCIEVISAHEHNDGIIKAMATTLCIEQSPFSIAIVNPHYNYSTLSNVINTLFGP